VATAKEELDSATCYAVPMKQSSSLTVATAEPSRFVLDH
jgi:hypothetical protein